MAAMDMALLAIGLLVVALAIMAIVLVRRLDALERDVSTRRQVDGLGERLDRLTDQVEQRKLGDQLQVKLTERGKGAEDCILAVRVVLGHNDGDQLDLVAFSRGRHARGASPGGTTR